MNPRPEAGFFSAWMYLLVCSLKLPRELKILFPPVSVGQMPAPSKPKRGQVEVPQGEMETLQVSQSPLRGASHVDRADLVQHHARIERLLSQMLGKILGRSELSFGRDVR